MLNQRVGGGAAVGVFTVASSCHQPRHSTFQLCLILNRLTTGSKTYPCVSIVGETAQCSKYIGIPRNSLFTFAVYLQALCIKKN